MNLRLHEFLPRTQSEGPGERACVFVQGCPIHCPGCFNTATWDPRGGSDSTVDELFAQIATQTGLEGVTFVGGEPFAQAAALAALGKQCRHAGLSVVTFTGLEYDVIRRSGRPDWNALLAVTDLLLAGPFKREQRDFTRPWVGSRNQQFIFLTERYRHLESRLAREGNSLELRFDPGARLRVNGLAAEELLARMGAQLANFGLQTSTHHTHA
jgi:anaerobic ribonucleoside-triphosphate reductase activating protein